MDLIDRQAAIDALKAKAVPLYKDPECNDIWERDRTIDNAIDVIRGLPSVDAVEVVRCKACKYSEHWYKDKRRCFLWNEVGIDVFEDGFCNYARKENRWN